DALGKHIALPSDEENFALPKGGDLRLSLDAEVQMIIEEELEETRLSTNAKATMAVMIDSDTGEILGLGQSPALNLNVDVVPSREALKNLVVETVFEPGSIFKPIVAAAAIEMQL